MYGRYSERAQRVIIRAQDVARRLGFDWAGTEHLLLGLIDEGQGIAAIALRRLGVDLDQSRAEMERALGRGDATSRGEVKFTPRGRHVIMDLAIDEARAFGHAYVGTEHLLLGLLAEAECAAARTLALQGATLERVRALVPELLGGGPASAGPPSAPGPQPTAP